MLALFKFFHNKVFKSKIEVYDNLLFGQLFSLQYIKKYIKLVEFTEKFGKKN